MTHFGRFIEPFIFDDFYARRGPCTGDDFFDRSPGSTDYVDFLLAHNPAADPVRIGELARRRRPDMLTHRPPHEWREIKPASVFGAIDAWIKLNEIIPNYAERGLPYQPGRSYRPTPEIVLGRFITLEGEKLDLILMVTHKAPGLLFWQLREGADLVKTLAGKLPDPVFARSVKCPTPRPSTFPL
jgi:hypothetical protein